MVQTPLILLAEPATSDAIRRKATEVVSRAEYQLDEGLSEESQTLWLMLLRTLLRPFVWLSDVMGGLPAFMQVMVIILLLIVVLALMTHIIWSIVAAAREKLAATRRLVQGLCESQIRKGWKRLRSARRLRDIIWKGSGCCSELP